MPEHPMGRRAYDDDLILMLGRVDERTVQIVHQIADLKGSALDAEGRLVGRIAKVEVRLDALEDMHAEERGATRERGRWFSVVKMVKDLTPAGGVAAAVALALHQLWGAK